MQRVSLVFGDDNTFLHQCGIWDSLMVWVFWIKCVEKEGTVGRGICVIDGQGKTLWFPWHLVLQPAESSLACTCTLAGHRCALHTATKPTEPVCGGSWVTDCMGSCGIPVNSHGLLPIQVIDSLCVWVGHLSGGFPEAVLYHCKVTRVWSKVLCLEAGAMCSIHTTWFISQCQQDICWCVPSGN